jgi:hypothetical protein
LDAGYPGWLHYEIGKKKKQQWPVINIQIYFSVVPVRSSWDENNGDNNGVGR